MVSIFLPLLLLILLLSTETLAFSLRSTKPWMQTRQHKVLPQHGLRYQSRPQPLSTARIRWLEHCRLASTLGGEDRIPKEDPNNDDVLLSTDTTVTTSSPSTSVFATTTTTRIRFRNNVPIKESLQDLGMDRVMVDNPWLLTAISLGHYLLYPLGLGLAWFIFLHNTELQQQLSNSSSSSAPLLSVFLILVGHLMNAWGSAMAGTLVHEVEDWQVAELAAATASGTNNKTNHGTVYGMQEQRMVDSSHSNNPQLYSVAYTMLMGSIAMGNLCIASGVLDIANNVWMQGWALYSILGYFFANDEPYCNTFWYSIFAQSKIVQGTIVEKTWNELTDHGRKQIFRVSAFKFHGIFLPNALLCGAALVRLFGSSPFIPSWMAPLPLVLSSLGGIWEGILAETTFDQRHHLVAAVLISGGYALYFPFYATLFAS